MKIRRHLSRNLKTIRQSPIQTMAQLHIQTVGQTPIRTMRRQIMKHSLTSGGKGSPRFGSISLYKLKVLDVGGHTATNANGAMHIVRAQKYQAPATSGAMLRKGLALHFSVARTTTNLNHHLQRVLLIHQSVVTNELLAHHSLCFIKTTAAMTLRE